MAKTSYLASEQQLHLVKLLSPTNLRQGVHDEGNTHFSNSDSSPSFGFAEFNGYCDLVRPMPGNDTCEPGIVFPFSLQKAIVDTILLPGMTSL